VSLANSQEIIYCLANQHDTWSSDKARQNLKGLLSLRIKLETEMITQGFTPLPLVKPLTPGTD